jgi:hypothetical protein
VGQRLSRLLARGIVFDVSLLDATLQYRDNCPDDLPSHICPEDTNLAQHQTEACREQFSGSSKTGDSQRALTEALIRQANGARIPIRATCDLAQYPVAAACVS